MPEWRKIQAATADGAATPRAIAAQLDGVPAAINAAFLRMPDGKEQRQRMENNSNGKPAPVTVEVNIPAAAADTLRQLAPHYDQTPAPWELADLTAKLMHGGTSLRTIAAVVDRPLHVVQGWAAQGGYLTAAVRARHDEIRQAIGCGAESLQDIADLTGITRERVRQLVYSMPDAEEIYEKLDVKLRRPITRPTPVQEMIIPEPAPEPVAPRGLTAKERRRLLAVVSWARSVQRNATPQARRALVVRDQYARKLYDDGVSLDDIAAAVEVHRDSVRDWVSPAKQHRRQLVTEAIARRQRAKRRS
jgi:hypothetical protein